MTSGNPETGPASRKRRRFQFSLRTLAVGVLVYATLWTITAVWGSRSAERRYIGFDNPGQRMDRTGFEEVCARSPRDHECYCFEATAYAPFLLRVQYRYSLQNPAWRYDGQGSHGDGWAFWFFGYHRWLAGRRMIT